MSKRATSSEGPSGGHNQVTFGPYAVAKGSLVAFLIFCLGSLAFALFSGASGPAFDPDASGANPFGVWAMAVAAAFAGSLFFCVPLAIGLGMLLRRVTRQSVHVAAFFLFFGLLAAVPSIATFEPGDAPAALGIALAIGTLAAIGRASVIGNVYLTDTTTTPEPAHAS